MKYFTIEELTHTNTGLKNVPNVEQKLNLYKLGETLLDPIREKLGKPIKISSGFRSTDVNRVVGGVPDSLHCLGSAADIYCDGLTPVFLFNFILTLGLPFNEIILEPTWVHIALNPRKPKSHKVLKKTATGYIAIK